MLPSNSLLRLLLALSCSVALLGCGDDDAPTPGDAGGGDAGVGSDAGEVDGGDGTDAGATDAGGDDAGGDAGGVDAGPPVVLQSRLTVLIGGTPVTLSAVDQMDQPLLFRAGAAFDHDTTPGETVFMAEGSDRRQLLRATSTTVVFGPAVPFVDGGGAAVTPDVLVAGQLGGMTTNDALIGTVGSNARIYDFSSTVFGPAVALTEGTMPFTPTSASFLTVVAMMPQSLVALRRGSPDLYIFRTGTFMPIISGPNVCGTMAPINPNLVLTARFPAQPADSVILIDRSDAYLLSSFAPVCFSGPFALVDGSGASLTPRFAFGWDFDGNGTDDVVLVDNVAL